MRFDFASQESALAAQSGEGPSKVGNNRATELLERSLLHSQRDLPMQRHFVP
jgi:hypothetical protein